MGEHREISRSSLQVQFLSPCMTIQEPCFAENVHRRGASSAAFSSPMEAAWKGYSRYATVQDNATRGELHHCDSKGIWHVFPRRHPQPQPVTKHRARTQFQRRREKDTRHKES